MMEQEILNVNVSDLSREERHKILTVIERDEQLRRLEHERFL